jgi:hypothetical protein
MHGAEHRLVHVLVDRASMAESKHSEKQKPLAKTVCNGGSLTSKLREYISLFSSLIVTPYSV